MDHRRSCALRGPNPRVGCPGVECRTCPDREIDRVAVGGAVQQVHRRSRGDDGPADLDISGDTATREELHRRLQPQDFLDRLRDQFRLLVEQFDRLGISQQHQHAVRDGVDRRIVSGDQQKHRVRRSFLGSHRPIGAVLVVHQLGQHVVLRFREEPVDQVGHVRGESGGAFLALLRAGPPFLGGRVRTHVSARHEVEDPAVKGGFILERHAEDLADHRHRHRIGVLIDDVERVRALGPYFVERVVAQRLDVGRHGGDDVRRVRRREVPHDLPSLLVVLGRVGHDETRLARRTPACARRRRRAPHEQQAGRRWGSWRCRS